MKAHRKVAREVSGTLRELLTRVETAQNELEEWIDARSEKWAESETAERANADLANLQSAVSSLEEVADALDEVGEEGN